MVPVFGLTRIDVSLCVVYETTSPPDQLTWTSMAEASERLTVTMAVPTSSATVR